MIYDREWIEKPITFYTDNKEPVRLKLLSSRYKYPKRVYAMDILLFVMATVLTIVLIRIFGG